MLRSQTIKLPQENTGSSLHDLESGGGFLDVRPKAQATEETRQLDVYQNKDLGVSNTVKKW